MGVKEIGLYYLQSRYYNPTTGRFLNADAFTATGQGILGNNMFAYCLNNPVAFQDGWGHSALLTTLGVMAVGGIFGGLVNAISVASNGGSAQDCASAALAGFIGGAIGVGTAALMVTNCGPVTSSLGIL